VRKVVKDMTVSVYNGKIIIDLDEDQKFYILQKSNGDLVITKYILKD